MRLWILSGVSFWGAWASTIWAENLISRQVLPSKLQQFETESKNEEQSKTDLKSIEISSRPETLVRILREQLPIQPWNVGRLLVEHALEKMVPTSPEYQEALVLAAQRAARDDRHGEAVLYYERRKRISSENDANAPQLLVELGREYRSVGAMRKALDTFYEVLKTVRFLGRTSDPALKAAQWEIAETSYMIHDWKRAQHLFEMFTETHPQDDPLVQSAYYLMAACSQEMGDKYQTIVDYERALAHNDRHPLAAQARAMLFEIFLERDDRDKAVQMLQELARSVSRMPSSEMMRWKRYSGELLFRQMARIQSLDLAMKILNALGEMDPSPEWQKQVNYWKGLTYVQGEQWNEALQSFSRVKEQEPLAEQGGSPAIASEDEKSKDPLSHSMRAEEHADQCRWILNVVQKQIELDLPPPLEDSAAATDFLRDHGSGSPEKVPSSEK